MRETGKVCIAILALVLLALPAFSQDQATTDKRISDLEKKIEELMKEQEAPKLRLMNNAEEERVQEPVGLTSFYDNGYLVASSADGSFKYWLDGRVMVDAAAYKGAENRLASGAEIRRGRIGVKATLYRDWLAEVDIDFANNAVEIKDMWGGYAGWKNSVLRVGNHKAPFSLETLTSSKYIVFIERGYPDSMVPDRRLGISYSHWGRNWQYSAGVFGQAGGTFNDKDTLTGGGAGTSQRPNFVGRVSYAPVNERGRVVHLGLGAAHMRPDVAKVATSGSDLPDRLDASRVWKFDSRPETHVSRAKFLSTGDIKYINYWNQTDLELATVFNSLSFQAEYQQTKVKRLSTPVASLSDHKFKSYYAFVSWFPTGDIRPYSASEGEFGRIVPKHKYGAVELALRLSKMDLNDITTVDPITGGSAQNVTLGANWYFNANHRLMFDVTKVNNDKYAKPGKDFAPIPSGTSTAQNVVYGDDFTIIAVRYAIAF